MVSKIMEGLPLNYSDQKISVYLEVADKQTTKKYLENLDFISKTKELAYGFEIQIAIQQIPEVIRYLSMQNIAIYAVIPKK